MQETEPADKATVGKHALRSIALWQAASFLLLLLLIWINDLWELSSCTKTQEGFWADHFGSILLSFFVILTAVITIGQTYVKQKHILSGFITVCSNCHKIRIRKHAWEAIEMYIADRYPVEFSHGLCPQCFAHEMADIENHSDQKEPAN